MPQITADSSAPPVPALSPPRILESTPLTAGASAATNTNTVLRKLGEYKEFITIIVAAIGGLWLAIGYFVTRERFVYEMIHSQCQTYRDVAQLSVKMDDYYYKGVKTWTDEKEYRYKIKMDNNIVLNRDESHLMQVLDDGLAGIKVQQDISAARERLFQEALDTGNCAKLITVEK